jgi:hypothetical protein
MWHLHAFSRNRMIPATMPSPKPKRRARSCVAPCRLPDQPGRAEQRVANHQRHAGQQAEGTHPVEPAAGMGVGLDPDTLEDGAE